MYLDCAIFIASMAPFVDRKHGSNCLRRGLPKSSHENQSKALNIWIDYLKPMDILTKISMGKAGLVARQFGFIQFLQRSFFTKEEEICLANTTLTERD